MSELWTHISELIERGGILMVPILACSVVALGILVERLLALRIKRLFGGRSFEPVLNHLQANEFSEALIVFKAVDSPAARILTAGLSVHDAVEGKCKLRWRRPGEMKWLRFTKILKR